MSPYQSGHSAYSQSSSNPSAASSRYDLYTSPAQQSPLQRMPSYDAGDDAGFFDSSRLQGANGRLADADWEDQMDNRYMQTAAGHSPQASRSRGLSQGSPRYRYATSTQRPYNPQEFVVPPTPSQQQQQQQLAFNSLANSNSNASSYTTTTAAGHQPYNPAAYQPANLAGYGVSQNIQRQTSIALPYAQTPSTPLSYGFPSQQIPPPPPPRGPDHPYGSRPSVSYAPGSPEVAMQQAASAAGAPARMAYSMTSPSIASSTAYASRDSITGTSLG